MDIDFWYAVVLVLLLIYIVPVLIIRISLNRRTEDRRYIERRVCVQHVPIERRQTNIDRRAQSRRV